MVTSFKENYEISIQFIGQTVRSMAVLFQRQFILKDIIFFFRVTKMQSIDTSDSEETTPMDSTNTYECFLDCGKPCTECCLA